VNQQTETLREIITTRFRELEDHLAALEKISGHSIPGNLFQDYLINQIRYELYSLSESLEEIEERLVILETYQTFIRFASRQTAVVIVSVGVTFLMILLVFNR